MLLSRTAMFASPLGERLLFYSMSGRETLGRPFTYEVDLLSESDSIDLSELLGQLATVVLERTDGSIREFNGFVTQFSLVGEHGNFARYRAILRPWLWFLGQNRDSRIFHRASVPEIATTLFRDHGFSDVEDALSAKYRTWEYLVQYRESDLNFVSRMLEQEGIYYFFKHGGGKHTLVLADSLSAHEPSPGYDTVPYFPPLERERRQEEHIDTWLASRQIRQGVVTIADFDFERPAAPFEGHVEAPVKAGGSHELYDYPGEVQNPPIVDTALYDLPGEAKRPAAGDEPPADEAQTQAQVRLEEHQADHEIVRGGGPVRGLMAGSQFSLSQYPRDDQNKAYLVVNANYEIRVSEYESNVLEDREPIFRFTLVAIDAKWPYRAPRVTRKPTVEGPQTAIVVGDGKHDVWTDPYGRVRVQFHWDRKGRLEGTSSCWVRVSQLWAGANWGGIHIPRVGQEVIVDFLEGDPDRPIITGRVYNRDNMPPYKLPDNRTQSGIKSRSMDGGAPDNFNELRFEDKKGEEELHLQAEKDMTTLVKNDQTTDILKNRVTNIGIDDTVTVRGNISVTIGNPSKPADPKTSTMNVTGKHKLDASDTIDIQAPTHISLTVGGSSIMITPGAITITAGGGASITLNADMLAASKGGSEIKLDANAFAAANGGASLLLDANVLAASKAGSQVLLDANASMSTDADVILDGAKITGTGKSEASITVGSSSVKLIPASVDVAGTAVNVNGTGMVSIMAPTIKLN